MTSQVALSRIFAAGKSFSAVERVTTTAGTPIPLVSCDPFGRSSPSATTTTPSALCSRAVRSLYRTLPKSRRASFWWAPSMVGAPARTTTTLPLTSTPA